MDNPSTTSNSLKHDKNTKISFYENFSGKGESEIHLSDVLRHIQIAPNHFEIIQKLRNESSHVKSANLKKKLPAVTPSGLFNGKRKLENLVKYSGFICMDFDDVKDPANVKNVLKLDPYSYAVFISPSGNGLKVLVKVNYDEKSHAIIFNSLCNYYFKKYNQEPDRKCKDIGRLMFLSSDPELFHNEKSRIWSIEDNYEFLFTLALSNLEKKESFQTGNRNSFVFKLSCACNRQKIDKGFCVNAILKKYLSSDFLEDEITRTVNSAYHNIESLSRPSQEILSTESLSLFARVEKYLSSKYDIRLNEISTKVEYRLKGSTFPYLELNENSMFRELCLNNLSFSFNKLTSLLQSDFVSRYNPFQDYFESLGSWADTESDYIQKLAEYVPVRDRNRFNTHFKKMLVRCIACSLEDNVFNKQVFVLVHSQQNSGKSTFCRWLCPTVLKDYLAENINTDKDSIIALATNFLINMDELATLSKTEINALKSLISKDKVNVRLPYGRRAVSMPRRANFIGSTNKDEFLTDETGSVRWLCFELTGLINFAYRKDIDINDVWRQAYALYKEGFQYQLTQQEIAENEASNRDFQVVTFEAEIIPKLFSPSSKEEGGQFVKATDIFKKITETYFTISTKCNIQAIGRAMKVLGFKKESKYMEGKSYSEKGYYVKEL